MPGARSAITTPRSRCARRPTRAYAQAIRHSTRDPRLMGAALALAENRIPEAEAPLREHLKRHPTDVAAIRMLAEVAARLGRYRDAENLLARCLELAPGFAAARHNYAMVLHRQNKPEAALAEVERLLGTRSAQSRLSQPQGGHARAHRRVRRVDRALPQRARGLSEPGQGVDELGPCAEDRRPASREHRRLSSRASSCAPELGEAYWSLANLKTFRFTAEQTRGDARAARRAPI